MFAIILPLTLLTGVPPVDDLTGPPFRLYEPHAKACLDSWAADPTLRDEGQPAHNVGLSVVTYGDPAATCAVVKRARAEGVQAHPAMRVYVANPIKQILTKSHWDNMAQQLEGLSACAQGRVAIDVEDYGPTVLPSQAYLDEAGLSVRNLRRRMKRFLDVVKTFDHVGIYPVNTNDLVHVAIIDSAGAAAEIWEERSFGVVKGARTSIAAYNAKIVSVARAGVTYRALWPRILIRAGVFATYIRTDGHMARKIVPETLGPLHPWIFDRHRGDTYGNKIANTCSRAYTQSLHYDSRNDVYAAWEIALPFGYNNTVFTSRKRFPDARNGYVYDLRQYAGGLNNSPMPKSDDGYVTVAKGKRMEVIVPLVDDKSYTMAATLRLKRQGRGQKVIVGRVRKIGSGDQNFWSVTATGNGAGVYFLMLHGGNFAGPKPLGKVTLGESFRATVRWDRPRATLTARVVDADGNAVVATTREAGTAFDTYALIGVQPHRDNGAVELGDQFVVAQRAWTDKEMAREAVGTTWPWGR